MPESGEEPEEGMPDFRNPLRDPLHPASTLNLFGSAQADYKMARRKRASSRPRSRHRPSPWFTRRSCLGP